MGADAAGMLQSLFSVALSFGAVVQAMSVLYLAPLVNRQAPPEEKIAATNRFAARVLALLTIGGVTLALFPRLTLTILFSRAFVPAAAALFAFVVWQSVHQIAIVYLQLLIGLDDVGYYAAILGVGYGVAALLFGVLISRFGLIGAAAALATGMVISSVGVAVRLRHFGGSVSGNVIVRTVLCLAAIAGAGMLALVSPEATSSGGLLRAVYAVVVGLVLWATLSQREQRMALRAVTLRASEP